MGTPSEALIREMRRRRYSERTIKTYCGCLERFLAWCKKPVNNITKKDVREWIEFHSDKGQAGNTLNVNLMALKFYFEQCLGRKIWVDIHYTKTPKRIQRVLTKKEVFDLINYIKNSQHKLMISLMYSAGLRVSELLNLRVKDLDIEKNYGFVRNGKGGKDRLFIIAEKLKKNLHLLIENKNAEEYLFLTNRKNKYNIRSIQQIVKKSSKSAKIENWKEVHCHTLRHSFATHLIENDYSVSDVQAMLGHKSPETSMGYVHASGNMISVKSPFDYL
jgi:site-specific recombinase XerD